MRHEANRLPSEMAEVGADQFRRFLVYLGGFLGLGTVTFLAMLLGLSLAGSLPAAPLTATNCIDEKFKYLAGQDLGNADLLAVGSSVTWRNLDLRPFVARGLAERPINAAPCYLYMDQMLFLTRFLLDHQKHVETVISIVAPRDFGYCNERDRAFFDPDKAASYVFGKGSPLPIYLTNFRPLSFIPDALSVAQQRQSPSSPRSLFMGPYGAGPIEGSSSWSPAPSLDAACFAALTDFEEMLVERGVRLVVVSFLPSPAWRAEHDPDGEVIREFEERLQAALGDASTVFISGGSLQLDEAQYFDAIHFRWQDAKRFSSALAERLAPAEAPAGTAGRAPIAAPITGGTP